MKGEWISTPSQLGITQTILYKTPSNDHDSDDNNNLVEALDIGFGGMSGAVAINDNNDLVAMFVNRGTLIPSKRSIETDETITGIPRKDKPNNKLYTLIQLFFRSILGFNDDKVDSNLSNIGDKLDGLIGRVDQIDKEFVKWSDLKELGAVFDSRRGIFITSSAIIKLIHQPSISINDIENSDAPE
eukprot:CAMPEP_0196763832 /NCGR_PEP_ID=MMETSP1095-20130614/4850_1 /TAXON_ID=96789 ORGANISM="Chromulina nebulosa, Strain UTEXLB2642" /NCGR_SAMPLE_ID=MMETSP1095 /ASSEMBLY_ACC=CAM_ASM_000446 /LENGTH=185 /DNA_ID=CAMNT_0042117907 /DNA_START=345 /DNA_END=899 /DNA_ORIENTATION=+